MAKKRIAARFFVHQLRERRGAFRLAAKRIRNQLPEVFTARGASVISSTFPPAVLDRLKLARQRMSGIDLVVPIGAISIRCCRSDRVNRSSSKSSVARSEPLQIVEEQRQADVPAAKMPMSAGTRAENGFVPAEAELRTVAVTDDELSSVDPVRICST